MRTVGLHEFLAEVEERKQVMATAIKAEQQPGVKTLDDVKADMSDLYEQVKLGAVDLRLASELANITGKYLKAVQLDLAREIFLSNQSLKKIGHIDA